MQSFCSSILCILGFLSCFLFQIPFLIFVFSWYSVMFFVQHQCFWFQKTQVEKHQFWVKRGVATKRFFLITCVLQNVKSYRFFAPCLAKFRLMFNKHYKIGISAHVQKQKKKNDHFEGLLPGPSKGYYLGHVCCNIKMANLAQIVTLQIFAHTFFKKKEVLKPIFL